MLVVAGRLVIIILSQKIANLKLSFRQRIFLPMEQIMWQTCYQEVPFLTVNNSYSRSFPKCCRANF